MPDKMMRIEVVTKKFRGTDPVTGMKYDASGPDPEKGINEGDRFTVSYDWGVKLCGFGWVKDLSGEVESGPLVPGHRRKRREKRIKLKDSVHVTSKGGK